MDEVSLMGGDGRGVYEREDGGRGGGRDIISLDVQKPEGAGGFEERGGAFECVFEGDNGDGGGAGLRHGW